MAFRIVNKDRPQETWVEWVEIVPLRPTSYVDVKARFPEFSDSQKPEVVFANETDQDRDGRIDLPPGAAETALDYHIRGDGKLFDVGQEVVGKIDPTQPTAELRPQVTMKRGHAPAEIGIDGVPRASVWQIDFDNHSVESQPRQAIQLLRIGMVKGESTPGRLYTRPESRHFPKISDDEKKEKWPVIPAIGQDDACASTYRGAPAI